MQKDYVDLLKKKCGPENYEKLSRVKNRHLHEFIGRYVGLCNPRSVFVRTDSPGDARYIRERAVETGEEKKLRIEGHTYHFDGYFDQARDKENTRFLVTPDMNLGGNMNSIDRDKGLKEIDEFLTGIMDGREMFVLFLCLGPANSDFSIYAVQLTDSAYVAHSEDILFRGAYEVFKEESAETEFFKYVHSAGRLENYVSRDVDKRRIYIDFAENLVYSVNTQYAGNTVGLKKLSLRLAINKADREKWLAEHMFVMAVHGPEGRKTYLTGAFPSFCGKTSTCMVKGERILGDDIAYLKKRNGKIYAVNAERGIFGIINNVNADDDPLIWEAMNEPGDVIFSNMLIADGRAYWQGDKRPVPDKGINYSGDWFKGKKDRQGREIPHSYDNARYTVKLESLKNCDPELDNPEGVGIRGIIYGGRDSDTWPPVFRSFDWAHGVVTAAASLESETTAATLGREGVRTFNLMANLDFLSIPVGRYIQNHLDFTAGLDNAPFIFGVNYFLKSKNGDYLTGMQDKRVWLKWMELAVHDEVKSVETPIGFIPVYEDLKRLFKEVLNRDYDEDDYRKQFTIRIDENLAKIDRIIEIYRTKVPDAPEICFDVLRKQKQRLEKAKIKR